jgi:2-haloacid dehalogenase
VPKAVIFDLGGVFIDWDPRYLYRKLFGAHVGEMEDFLANVCTRAWHDEQDRGKPTAQACAELAAAHPEQAWLVNAWAERNEEMVGGIIEGSVGVLAELKAAGVPCYVLSNMEYESWQRRLKLYEFLSWFDGYVISALVGTAKPDREIFELALDRFGLQPADALFVDDNRANVAAAAEVGIQAVLFSSPGALRDVLVAAGLLGRPRPAGAPEPLAGGP